MLQTDQLPRFVDRVSNARDLVVEAARSPMNLAMYASQGRMMPARHLELLDDHLMRCARREIDRLMVLMPPRHGKSETITHYMTAWWRGTYPDDDVILASYEDTLARRFSRRARETLADVGADVFGVEVSDVRAAASDWGIKDHWGETRSAGVGGGITGRGAHLLIIDDPVKNAEEARSVVYRDRVWDWWESTARPRIEPGGVCIVVMTPWDEDDLSGRLLRPPDGTPPDSWHVLRLPAIAEEDDQLGREPGEVLWPERFEEAEPGWYERRRDSMPAYWWNALYQCRPSPEQGSTFDRNWMTTRWAEATRPTMQYRVQAMDSAWKEGVGADWSVITTWASDGVDFYLEDEWRARVEYPTLQQAALDQYEKHRPHELIIEDAASGTAVIQSLRRQTPLPIRPFRPVGSKRIRAERITPLFAAGKVYLPNAPFLTDWIEEHLAFPAGRHDDRVDTTSMALARLMTLVEDDQPSEVGTRWDAALDNNTRPDPFWDEDAMGDHSA